MQDNVEYLRKFIGEEWIKAEVKKIENKSMLKEVGRRYFNYHPFVQFHYEIQFLIRRADALKEDSVLMGEFWEKLNRTGYLVKLQKDKIVDENEFRNRLRSAEQFDDALFELEVATILRKNNIEYNFKAPVIGDSNDITCFVDNRSLEIECKNKHILDARFNRNDTFSHMLCNALSEIKTLLKGKIIEIEFEDGNYEDIKTIVNEVKNNLKDNKSINVLDKYTIGLKYEYIKMSVEEVLNLNNVQRYYMVGEQKKSELYTKDQLAKNNLFGMVCKFPSENRI